MSSVYFSWSSYAVQRKTARRHSERMLLKLRYRRLSEVLQRWRPALQYLIAAQQYWRVASEMGKGTSLEPTYRSSREVKTAVACLTAWTVVANSGRKLKERCKQTIVKRRRASSREFFHRWTQAWGMRRRQVQSAVACLKMLIRGHNRQKRDVLRTFACFVRVQMQRRVAMVRVERRVRFLLSIGAMAAWWEYSRKALRERRVLLKKHMDIQGRLWACHEEESGHSDGIHMYFTRLIFSSWVH